MSEKEKLKNQITESLLAWSDGNEAAINDLMPLVEIEFRRIARNYMRRESPNHTLQTTALVNEAYLKVIDQKNVKLQNRSHFYALMANFMRRILLNHARDRFAQKRGGKSEHIELDEFTILSPEKTVELIALDEALERLAEFDKLKSRIVELRYFGGFTLNETADLLNLAPITISIHWRLAKDWLAREIRY